LDPGSFLVYRTYQGLKEFKEISTKAGPAKLRINRQKDTKSPFTQTWQFETGIHFLCPICMKDGLGVMVSNEVLAKQLEPIIANRGEPSSLKVELGSFLAEMKGIPRDAVRQLFHQI
jgi:hypothetical protein